MATAAIVISGSPFAQGRGGRGGRPGEGRTPEFPPPSILDYYRDYQAFWKLYGMGLPDDALKKLSYANALKLVPGLSRDRFPS